METVNNQMGNGAEVSHSEQREAVLTEVIMSLPELLSRLEDLPAAKIVAGLLRAQMIRREPDAEVETEDGLDAAVRKAREDVEREYEY